MKKIITILYILFCYFVSSSQDIHFSQFTLAPMQINPANTGGFDNEHRIIANYKSQWQSVDKTYLTYGLSYDMAILKKKLNGGKLGIGLQFYHDRAGFNHLNHTMGSLSLAYHLPVNENNFITAGIQGAFTQQNIDNRNMQWDNQYDPNTSNGYNAGLPSGETFNYDKKSYGDVSAGMTWSYNSAPGTLSSNDARRITAGVSVFHINRPKQSFSDVNINRLYMKVVVHGQAFIGFRNTNLALLPSAVWFYQGPCHEVIFGTLVRYRLNDASKYTNYVSETAISAGVHYRWNDAIIAALQFEWKNFHLGISYDINSSELSNATKGAGGLEVALKYVTPLFPRKSVRQF